MTPNIFWSAIAILAVWRVTHLFNAEDGPWNLLVKLRRAAGEGFWGSLLDCFCCLSLWVAIPAAWLLGTDWKQRILLWPAISGAAILLERLPSRNTEPITVNYSEDAVQDEENEDVLRQR
jgi:hypothetical protein